MKKLLFVMMCSLLAIGFAGCSDEEESEKIVVNYQLLNEAGVECYDFREGENIIFKLEIKNNTDEDVIFPPISEIIGSNIFHVYTRNEKDMGMPWDELFSILVAHSIIGAHSSTELICPWFDMPSLSTNGHVYSECFIKKSKKSALPKGEYYSKFDIKLDSKTITCNRTFKIR